MKKALHAGKLSISSVSSNVSPYRFVNITLVDEASRTTVIDLNITHEEFGQAITGLSERDCRFAIRGEKVGKIREHCEKVIELDFRPQWDYVKGILRPQDQAKISKVIANLTCDGWYPCWEDFTNQHRAVSSIPNAAKVRFERWVDAAPENE